MSKDETIRTLAIIESDYRELVSSSGIDFDLTSHPDRVEAIKRIRASAYQRCADYALKLHLDNAPDCGAIERLHKAYMQFSAWAAEAETLAKLE
jgi:hypothetical protein